MPETVVSADPMIYRYFYIDYLGVTIINEMMYFKSEILLHFEVVVNDDRLCEVWV